MIIGIILVIIAVINTLDIKKKEHKMILSKIINCWTFPVVYVACFAVEMLGKYSCYIYGLVIIITEKMIYYYVKRKDNAAEK